MYLTFTQCTLIYSPSFKFLSKTVEDKRTHYPNIFLQHPLHDDEKIEIIGFQINFIQDYHYATAECTIDGITTISNWTNSDIKYEINKEKKHYNETLRIATTIATLEVFPQFKIDNYRIDFAFILKKYYNNDWHVIAKYSVECDGFDFHHTKEQINNDNNRLRHLITKGFTTIKFSGADIYKIAPVTNFIETLIYNFGKS